MKKNALKLIILALCALCLVQGTLAWQNIRQTATNEMYYQSDHSPVRLVKYQRLADGTYTQNPLPGAEFVLLDTPLMNQIGGPYVTDELGEIRLEDKLAPGSYILRETKCPPGYTFDIIDNAADGELDAAKTDYLFTVDPENGDAEVLITAYNRRITGSLTLTKKVASPGGAAPDFQHTQRDFAFTLTLDPLPAEGDLVTYTVTDSMGNTGEAQPLVMAQDGSFYLPLRHGETAVFSGIPEGTEYTLAETPAEGYITTSEGSFGTITAEGAAAVFTNTVYQDPSKVGTLIVKKTVQPTPSDTETPHHFSFVVRYPAGEGDTVHADTFTLAHDERYIIDNIPAGTVLTVAEIQDDPNTPPEEYPAGYYPHTKEEVVTIPAGDTVTVEFVNAYNPDDAQPGSLEISKTVLPPAATDQNPNPVPDASATFVFDLQFSKYPDPIVSEDGTATPVYYAYTVTDAAGNTMGTYEFKQDVSTTITLKHGETALFNSIPHGVEYTVAEQTAPGFIAKVNRISGTIVGGRTSTARFENMPEGGIVPPPAEPHDIYLTKVIKGEFSDEDLTEEQKQQKFNFTLALQPFEEGDIYPYSITDGTEAAPVGGSLALDAEGRASFALAPGQTIQIIGIPMGTKYSIVETDYQANHYLPASTNCDGTMGTEDVHASVTNTYVGEILINIHGIKTWDDIPEGVTKPESIQLNLMNGDTTVQTITVFPKDGDWEFDFTNVPKYDSEGNLIAYTIRETPIPGFAAVQKDTTYDEQGEPTYRLENVYVPPVTNQDDPLSVEKIIAVTEEGAEAPDKAFEFVLSRQTQDAPMPGGSMEDHVSVTINGQGEASFDPITFAAPGEYQYTIAEVPGSSAGWTYDGTVYTAVYKVTYDGDELEVDITLRNDEGKKKDEAVFTNQFDPAEAEKYTSISGEKKWEHKANPKDKQPGSVTINLLANEVIVDSVTITAEDGWKYSFDNLPVNDESGASIKYTITEARIGDYVPKYTKTDHGYDILNTYSPTVAVDPPIARKYIDGTNPPSRTFTFIMEAKANAPMPEGSTGTRKAMTLTGEGTIEFGTIYYDKAGIYEYTIYEQQESASGWIYDDSRYSLMVTVTDEGNGLQAKMSLQKNSHSVKEAIFTNLYNKAGWDERIVIEGVKYWDHGSNPKLMRPTSIRVFLYGNGQYVAEKQVTAADGWEYMFVVPKYTASGTPITYVIDELEIEHYSKHVDGYDLLNTYVGEDSPSGPRPKPTKDPSFSPDTGDTTNLPLWIAVFAVSALGMIILAFAVLKTGSSQSRKKRK